MLTRNCGILQEVLTLCRDRRPYFLLPAQRVNLRLLSARDATYDQCSIRQSCSIFWVKCRISTLICRYVQSVLVYVTTVDPVVKLSGFSTVLRTSSLQFSALGLCSLHFKYVSNTVVLSTILAALTESFACIKILLTMISHS